MSETLKLAVVGSRSFSDYERLVRVIDRFLVDRRGCGMSGPLEIVSGGARGADSLAERYANERGLATKIFLPDWESHGKGAGFIRNRDIVDYADYVIAFWDFKSKGTGHTVGLAKVSQKLYGIVDFTKPPAPTKEAEERAYESEKRKTAN